MTDQVSVSPQKKLRVADARARVRSAMEAVEALAKSAEVDASVATGLRAVGEALRFVGEHAPHIFDPDSDIDGPIDLVYVISDTHLGTYDKLSREFLDLLTMVAGVSFEDAELAAEVSDLLGRTVDFLEELWGEETPMNSDVWEGVGDQYIKASTTRSTFELLRRTVEVSAIAENAAEAAAESAGDAAQSSLAVEFEALRLREESSANWFRRSTIFILLGTLGFTAYVAFDANQPVATEALRKFALVIPAIALAAYLGREAGTHRRTANWAAVMVAQLRSIRAFVAELDGAGRSDLMLRFGLRVFTEAPSVASDAPSPTPGLGGDPDVARAIREAASTLSPPRP